MQHRAMLKTNFVDREEKVFLESRDPGWWSRRITELAQQGKVSEPVISCCGS